MKVTHIITGLPVGGAQTMLFNLIRAKPEMVREVISLSVLGTVGEKIRALGVPVHAMSMNKSIPNPMALAALAFRLRRSGADLVQTWMYHADLFGGLASVLAGVRPVIWNIRQSSFGSDGVKIPTRLTVSACARLSGQIPDAIVCNSNVAAKIHADLGYRSDKFAIIPNGIDVDEFLPIPLAGQRLREELGIPASGKLIGLVGRYHPQKNHAGFVAAAARLCAEREDVYFVLCGEDVDAGNANLTRMINDTGHADRFRLLGIRDDISNVTAALDLSTSSSNFGEAFSNIIGEAMACAVPCIVTDVGDSKEIVRDTGITVSPMDNELIFRAWQELLDLPLERRQALGRDARNRVLNHYSLDRAVQKYQVLYEKHQNG